jgi:hypothetical protein
VPLPPRAAPAAAERGGASPGGRPPRPARDAGRGRHQWRPGGRWPASARRRRREDLAAQRLPDKVHSLRRPDQPAALGAVGRENGLHTVRRHLGAQLGARSPVPLARALEARGQVMPGERGKGRRVAQQHAVHSVVGRNQVEQPGHRGLLESLAARRVNADGPARGNVRCHESQHKVNRTYILLNLEWLRGAARRAGHPHPSRYAGLMPLVSRRGTARALACLNEGRRQQDRACFRRHYPGSMAVRLLRLDVVSVAVPAWFGVCAGRATAPC